AAARARGARLGRPRVTVDVRRIATLRESGHSWPTVARELGISVGTAFQAGQRLSTNLPKPGLQIVDSTWSLVKDLTFRETDVFCASTLTECAPSHFVAMK